MRVLQLIDSLDVGGAERMAVNIANAFAQQGVKSILVVSRKNGNLASLLHDPQSIFLLEKRRFFDLTAFSKLLRLIREFKPTHLHAHDSSIYWAVLAAKFFPKVKVIWHAHYGGLVGEDSRFGKKIRLVAKGIDGFIAVNEELLDWANRELKEIPAKGFIPNFPSIPEIDPSKTKEDVILCLANLKPPKNHALLVKSFSDFRKSFPTYRLRLVGNTDDKDYLGKLQALITSLQLVDSVDIVGEQISLKETFESSKFAVLASEIEGLPVSVLEIGLAGIPMICSEVGQCPALLDGGRLGYLFPSGDREKLTRCMEEVAGNYPKAKEKASDFKLNVEERFGSERFMQLYRDLLHEIN
ncbi:glycosyltransferase [Algoriphagus namhaensis]